jgi:hypothetical protein
MIVVPLLAVVGGSFGREWRILRERRAMASTSPGIKGAAQSYMAVFSVMKATAT